MTNFLDMSDEEMANFDVSSLEESSGTEEVTAEEEVTPEVDESLSGEDECTDTTEASAPGDDDVDEDMAVVTKDEAEDAKAGTAAASEESDVVVEEGKEADATKAPEVTEPDYKAASEQVFKPFKSNGKQITVANPEDAISLMQMGANYNL